MTDRKKIEQNLECIQGRSSLSTAICVFLFCGRNLKIYHRLLSCVKEKRWRFEIAHTSSYFKDNVRDWYEVGIIAVQLPYVLFLL